MSHAQAAHGSRRAMLLAGLLAALGAGMILAPGIAIAAEVVLFEKAPDQEAAAAGEVPTDDNAPGDDEARADDEAPGDGATDAAAAPQVDAQAEAVLRKLVTYAAELKTVALEANMVVDLSGNGMKMQTEMKYDVRIARPNRFAVVAKPGRGAGMMMGVDVFCDGEQIWLHIPALERYSVEPLAPGSDPFADMGGTGLGPAMFHAPLLALFGNDAYAALTDEITRMVHMGQQALGDERCDRVLFSEGDVMDYEFWITTGEAPLLRRIVPDMSKLFAAAAEEDGDEEPLGGMEMKLEIRLDNWRTNVELAAADFTFTPPEGAEKVDNLFAGLEGAADEEVHPLLGQPAPPLKLALLDGGTADLAAHRGRDVVILDFWATWCGPCRRAMPIIARVADRYREKGVVFYAVNLEEDPEQVREFLDETGLALTVALDADGKVGQAYRAEAIPQTVLVGKDGSVQVVHVGLLPELDEQLSAELEALLKGENLAAQALEAARAADGDD